MVTNPGVISGDIGQMSGEWALIRAIMGGTQAMRDAAETYLPKYQGESDTTYQNRLQKSVLTNYMEDAVRNAVSLPFRNDIRIEGNIPDDLKTWFNNVDLMGNDLNQFARVLLEDAGLMGYGFILVDFSKNDTDGTLGSEADAELRPYFTFVRADDCTGIYTQISGSREKCYHFRYREFITEIDEELKETRVERVRIYTPGQYDIYAKRSGGWVLDDSGPMSITDEVPVVPVWCGKRLGGGFRVRPLFLDLAYKQVEHWQSSSDQRNILSFARFPMLAVSGAGGAQENEITVGPSRVLMTEMADGKWYYVEPKGDAIEAGRKDLEDLKEEMRILGLQPIVGKYQNVTATSRALDETRVHSAVQVLAMNLEDALLRASDFMERWLGREPTEGKTILVNRDFGLSIRDTAEVDSLIRARITGEISRRTFWKELKRRQVLAPDFDADAEAVQLETEFLAGEIPFTVSAELPALPKSGSETEMNADYNITNTFAEIQGARNKAQSKGRSNIRSDGIKSATKDDASLIDTKVALRGGS